MITMFLANLLGWYFIIMGLFCLFHYDSIRSMVSDIMGQRGLLFLAAIITIIFGLILVIMHNVWVIGWPVIITLFAWLVLVSGIIRLFFPDMAIRMGQSFVSYPRKIQAVGVVFLILGLFLLFQVYYPYYIH